MKRFVWLALLLALLLVPVICLGEGSNAETNTQWRIENGTLYIEGSGNMNNYGEHTPAPWANSAFQKVEILPGVTSIGNYAFYGQKNLASITIPEGVTTIGDHAFCSCSGLRNITIPDSVTSIGAFSIGYCSSLTALTIPNQVVSIGWGAFAC